MRYKCCDLSLSAGKCIAFQYLFHGEISCYPVPVRSLKGKSSIIFFVDGKQTVTYFLLCMCMSFFNTRQWSKTK